MTTSTRPLTTADKDYTDFVSVTTDEAGDQWFAFHEHDVPGAVVIGCADERGEIPAQDPSDGGVVYLAVTWDKLAELHAAIGEVLSHRPA